MTGFLLAATGTEHVPSFKDADGCRQWLDNLPLASAVQAQALLLRQLKLLNRYALGAIERLRILELLRGPIVTAQEGCVRRYAWKPLPLTPAEQASFEATQALWQALADGYLHCLNAAVGGSNELSGAPEQVALLAERALSALCSALTDNYPGGRIPPHSSWLLLYSVFAAAEERGAATLDVSDRVCHGNSPTSAAAILAESALLHVAAPYELNSRQFGWLLRWTRHWAKKVPILAQAPHELKAVPFYLSLLSNRPPGPVPEGDSSMRWLDVSELRSSIKSRLHRLAAGSTPAELGLGEDCVSPGGDKLLQRLYQCWCKGGALRHHDHRAVDSVCRVVVGFAAAHERLSGKVFTQPHQGSGLSSQQHEEIATFGRIATHHIDEPGRPGVVAVEEWNSVEEWRIPDLGATGMKLSRPLSQASGRLSNGQLVAIEPQGAQRFLLGCLRWILVDTEEAIQASAEIFPGSPEPVAVRSAGLLAVNDKYRPAFLLPEVAVLKQPSRIVLPAGLFRQDLLLEVSQDGGPKIRLIQVIDRGSDYECASYQAAP